jgi:16S rRNA (cytosine967-C5)-methyltransferase
LRPSSIAQNGWRLGQCQNDSEETKDTPGTDIRSSRETPPALTATALLRQLSEEGMIYFQDEGSQMVAELLQSENHERVLDVCAAPGSKTTLIVAQAPEAVVVGGDLYQHRLRTMKELAYHQQTSNIDLVVYDATQPLPFTAQSFDRVLLDAPCSGTGTLRQNPEIRWRLRPSDIIELAAKQKRMLAGAAAMVRPGGVLVYSTCSLETEEGEEVVSEFREAHSAFEPRLMGALDKRGASRTWPHRDDVDGFFVMTFRRKN